MLDGYRYRYLVYVDEETDMRGLKELLKSRCVEGKGIEFIVYKGTVTIEKELEIQREFPDSLFREIAKGISIFESTETAEVGAKTETMEISNSNTNTRKVMFISRVAELNLEAKDNGISVIEIK